MKKMAEFRSEFLHERVEQNESFSEQEFRTRIRENREEGDRAVAPAETAPAPSASIGMLMPLTAPELWGRPNLAMFLQCYYTWASVAGYE